MDEQYAFEGENRIPLLREKRFAPPSRGVKSNAVSVLPSSDEPKSRGGDASGGRSTRGQNEDPDGTEYVLTLPPIEEFDAYLCGCRDSGGSRSPSIMKSPPYLLPPNENDAASAFSPSYLEDEEDKLKISAAFVAKFDVRTGHQLEWTFPATLNLENIEMTVLASGLHRMTSDYVYFSFTPKEENVPVERERENAKEDLDVLVVEDVLEDGENSMEREREKERERERETNGKTFSPPVKDSGTSSRKLYGIGWFHQYRDNSVRMLEESGGEREKQPTEKKGNIFVEHREQKFRFRFVGILSRKPTNLFLHSKNLRSLTEHLNQNEGELELLTKYAEEHWVGERERDGETDASPYALDAASDDFIPLCGQQIVAKKSVFAYHFLSYFGVSVFRLWKSLILQKRILLYAEVPLAPLCERCICLLQLVWTIPRLFSLPLPTTSLYISLSHADELRRYRYSYVNATSDRVYREKEDCWDVFCEERCIKVKDEDAKVLALSAQDFKRFDRLCDIAERYSSPYVEFHLRKYFWDLTYHLLHTLHTLSTLHNTPRSLSPSLSLSHHPPGETSISLSALLDILRMEKADFPFIREVCTLYGFDINVTGTENCCTEFFGL